jgi:hypothetical protein
MRVTPSGIECATVRPLAQCRNQLRHRVVKYYSYKKTGPFCDTLLEIRHDLVKAYRKGQNKLLHLPSTVGT